MNAGVEQRCQCHVEIQLPTPVSNPQGGFRLEIIHRKSVRVLVFDNLFAVFAETFVLQA